MVKMITLLKRVDRLRRRQTEQAQAGKWEPAQATTLKIIETLNQIERLKKGTP